MVNTTYKTQLPRLAQPATNNDDAALFAKSLSVGGHSVYGVLSIGKTFIVTCYSLQTATNIASQFQAPTLSRFYKSCVPYESREEIRTQNGHMNSYPCFKVAIKIK